MTFRSLIACLATILSTAAGAQQVDFALEDTFPFEETEIAYDLDLTLTAKGPTRLGVEALLDLGDFQEQIPAMLVGEALLDLCGNETIVEDLSLSVQATKLSILGRLNFEFFVCEKTGDTTFERGAQRLAFTADVRSDISTRIIENCVVLTLEVLTLRPGQELAFLNEENENLDNARLSLIRAIGLILEETKICPDLPPELASLDPVYDQVGPMEVGEGGLGLFLSGSIDVRAEAIIAVLNALQAEGVLPTRPPQAKP